MMTSAIIVKENSELIHLYHPIEIFSLLTSHFLSLMASLQSYYFLLPYRVELNW